MHVNVCVNLHRDPQLRLLAPQAEPVDELAEGLRAQHVCWRLDRVLTIVTLPRPPPVNVQVLHLRSGQALAFWHGGVDFVEVGMDTALRVIDGRVAWHL